MFLPCFSWFSLNFGTLSVERLLEEAAKRGYRRLALADLNNTSGIPDFLRLAPKYGIQPAAGITFAEGNQLRYIALAPNAEAYAEMNAQLSEQLKTGQAPKRRAEGMQHARIIYPTSNYGGWRLRPNEFVGVSLNELKHWQVRRKGLPEDSLVFAQPVIGVGPADYNTHRLLRAIDHNILLSRQQPGSLAPRSWLLPEPEHLREAAGKAPEIFRRTRHLFESCQLNLGFGEPKNKQHLSTNAETDRELLRKEAEAGAVSRYGHCTGEVQQRLEHELQLIEKLNFTSYFLICWDMLRYARSKGYFYVGRGSGANSLVAYCLFITNVDPLELDLFFERFINPSRSSPPDFDIDFSWKDRDDILQYLFNRYGETNVRLLGTYTTYQQQGVLRELGKVYGLPRQEIEELPRWMHDTPPVENKLTTSLIRYAKRLLDTPSHLSIHAGGVLISEKSMHYYTGTFWPPKGFPVTQCSMLEAEDLGLYKFDILSQRGLGHIREAVDLIRLNQNKEVDIHDISGFKRDPAIKALIREGHTLGCFYVESPAMRMLLRKLQAEEYPDLVAASSIIRPGVARSGMMKEYILRFRIPERRKQAHPALMQLLPETFGIMVYQEDVIRVAHHFAGMSLADADVLRRGMSGKFRSREEFARVKEVFFEGCRQQGHPEALSKEVWFQIESFASYSFSKGHSASFAVESFQSLWLKAHYPLEFMTAVINNFGGFYRTEYYIHEARRAGAIIEAPCVNHSETLSRLNGCTLWMGLTHIQGLESASIETILYSRMMHGAFQSLEDFVTRTALSIEQTRILIRIGAFRFTRHSRQNLHWELFSLATQREVASPTPASSLFAMPVEPFNLPPLDDTPTARAFDELDLLGFTLGSPFELVPPNCLMDSGIRAKQLANSLGQNITILGYLVTVKSTRTITKTIMGFGTFLDRDGDWIDTVHFPDTYMKHPFRGSGCYRIQGKVTEEFGFLSIEVDGMEKLPIRKRWDLQ